MTASGTSAIALGVAALVSFPLSAAYADTAPAGPNAAAPSLSEPAPTPSWAESGPGSTGNANATIHQRARGHVRHVVYRNHYRYVRAGDNFVADTASGVVGGVADLGSMAAYPFYCVPDYSLASLKLGGISESLCLRRRGLTRHRSRSRRRPLPGSSPARPRQETRQP